METFGDKLRQAAEGLGLTLEEVASATGLKIEHIRALVRNDFDALPDDEIVTEGLRCFARLVDVEPDEVIEDYLRERERWLELVPAELELVEEGIESPLEADEWLVVEPSKPRAGRRTRTAITVAAIFALAVIALFFWPRASTATASRRPSQVPPASSAAMAEESASPADAPARIPGEMKQAPAIERPTVASVLSIPDHGVGRGVVRRELVGRAERFAEGERVWFWTLVEGGTAGEPIHHVWFHEEEETVRVTLNLGGARWRTQSYKDLNPGSEGRWAVEARDEAGRVLARQEFSCSEAP